MAYLRQLSKEWYLATALYDAIDDANLREAASLVEEKHANPNIVIPDYGITPLHLAVGHDNQYFAKEITKLLLKNGGNPNIPGEDGITPVHVAAAWNRSAIVRLLLSYGGNPEIVDECEKNAFHYAYQEHAWDVVKTLEIYNRVEQVKTRNDEDKDYNISLDKVIIHSNNVQAEYRALSDSYPETPKSKHTVGTQTPVSSTKTKLPDENDEFISNQKKGGSDVHALDPSFDWCEIASDVPISEECKHKIVKHRSRSKVYEYSPKHETKTACETESRTEMEARRKYFPMNCCFEREKSDSRGSSNSDDSNSSDSFNTVEERRTEPVKPNLKQTATEALTSKNLVEKRDHMSSASTATLSDNSLISEDLSDGKLTKELSFFERTKDLPYIDGTESPSSHKTENASLNEAGKTDEEQTETNQKDTFEEEKNRAMFVHKESLRQVTWSGCLSTCACIPTRMNDSDSFSIYYASEKAEPKATIETDKSLPSGIDFLPTKSPEKSCFEDTNSSRNDDSNRIEGSVSIERKYTDDEDGIEFIEAKLPLSRSPELLNVTKHETVQQDLVTGAKEDSDISDPSAYETDYIRTELRKLGIAYGPMIGKPTKRLYLRKLKRLKKTVTHPVSTFMKPAFSPELEQVLKDNLNWIETLSTWAKLENDLRKNFLDSSLSSTWRNGTAKTSFTYLLLDPRITDNLPDRYDHMDLIEVWRTFVRAIFYIGKGTRARPYEHLHEAFTIWRETKAYTKRHCNLKVKYILEIWNGGLGVVCVQAFHNLMAAEAYTREAAMIDAIGLARLKNEKCGVYYGEAAKWNSKLKRRLGTFLLYRAMRIFIAENEIQLKPTDVN